MIRFNSDYTEGCHTAILEKLVETNMEQTAGYGVLGCIRYTRYGPRDRFAA